MTSRKAESGDVVMDAIFKLPEPVIVDMFRRLPPAPEGWPVAARLEWLRAMEAIFDMVYGPSERVDITARVTVPNSAEPTDEALARDVVVASGSGDDAAETTEAPAKPGVGSERSSSAETDLVAPKFEPTSGNKIELAPKNTPSAAESSRLRQTLDTQLRERPPGCPDNLELAIAAIKEIGPASAMQIRNWVARKHWSMVPDTWTGCLYAFVGKGKLARAGINFVLPNKLDMPQLPAGKPAFQLAPKTAPAIEPPPPPKDPPAPPPPAPKATFKFKHNEKIAELETSQQFALATRLYVVRGQHIGEAFLAEKVMHSNTEHHRNTVKRICLGLNGPLQVLGLRVEFYPGAGLIMKEVEG